MTVSLFDSLKKEINERQEELSVLQIAIEKRAERFSDTAKWFRIVIIFLGAFVATRDVAKTYMGDGITVVLIYTGVGLIITVLTSMITAFRYESIAPDLKMLAVACNAYVLDIDGKLPMEGDARPLETLISEAQALISAQNQAINDIQTKAAALGVNIVRKARKLKLHGDQSEG
ncbi:hypothetical protein SAMN04489760_11827 [Syntrophus gentianae]|uniref:SMODS and SLOG-associating 2TM effector domain-containing protein n=1 Tax=Syntrophus gentianae TaxID=43775 RepID=A0A1H7YWC6_9BACT|nr:hypothetical protein [Syntrophus gentianae]SEM49587.1 hypothetical protein SAMN04489760_11827 [Syntrophus gentianae]